MKINQAQTHSFHIPVMGTGFTIDTPIKVARFGISSVISLVDDHLIEKMRQHYCGVYGEVYAPIPDKDKDRRERRITEYLDLVDRIVCRQILDMKKLAFDGTSDLCAYFELMDESAPLRQEYRRVMSMDAGPERLSGESLLRERVVPGSIDANIMTKADRENSFNGEKLPRDYSDAMAALRGYAKSSVRSSIVLSAGLNPYLYSYLAEFGDFYPVGGEAPKKKVVLKVSDFRSALIQAKTLAKKGVWVSEYRIESGLNCGGHAFPTTGHLLGPILEEFKTRKSELVGPLFEIYRSACLKGNRPAPDEPVPVRITAQGGVGTSEEHRFLLRYYELDSVGWGTPFLLVPEATAVDFVTLNKLEAAGENQVYLSRSSPLGVPYYNLRNSASEETRLERIQSGKPGSPCLNKHLAMNTEYGELLCVASARYQKLKLEDLKKQSLSPDELAEQTERVLEKACICRDLGDGALMKYGIQESSKRLSPAVCPGPNIAYFSKICTLKEMVGHIYGRTSVLDPSRHRPHVFLNELKIYVDFFLELAQKNGSKASGKDAEYLAEFKKNLSDGVEYYKNLAKAIFEIATDRERFVSDLLALADRLEKIVLSAAAFPPAVSPHP